MYITSPSIYDPPTIDPAYLSHPADVVVLRQAIKLVRIIAASAPIAANLTAEYLPGAQIQSDPDIETYIRSKAGTEFHPSGTCSMLPRDKGGVIDARFKVYSIKNLRVVDSSVFPLSMCAHLMSATYALAETGAKLILSDWQSPGTQGGGGSKSSSTGSPKSSSKSGANRGESLVGSFFVFAFVMAGLAAT
jgi:choline dehydrogenase